MLRGAIAPEVEAPDEAVRLEGMHEAAALLAARQACHTTSYLVSMLLLHSEYI